jgi:hypothetical protein
LLTFIYNLQVKERYNDWMSSTVHALTPAGRIKRPSYSTVATWVKESWDDVDEDLIRRSFKCCGVSTNTDGSEDNNLFDYDKLLGMPEDDDEVDINNSDEENEFTEENDYENEWEIETDKRKGKENNGEDSSKEDDRNQNQELSSDEE